MLRVLRQRALWRAIQGAFTFNRWQRWCIFMLAVLVAVLLAISALGAAKHMGLCRQGSTTLADLFSYSQLFFFASGALAVGQQQRGTRDLVWGLLMQWGAASLDNLDGWAARDICGGSEEGTEWGHWLDHKVVDNIGEMYGCVLAMCAWREYQALWNLVLLRQAMSTSQDAKPRACGYAPHEQQSQYMCLIGCVNWHYTAVTVVRVLLDIVHNVEQEPVPLKQRQPLEQMANEEEQLERSRDLLCKLPQPLRALVPGLVGLHFLLWHNSSCGKVPNVSTKD